MRTSWWVYPRPRGGAPCGLPIVLADPGLSPPTRGSRSRDWPVVYIGGSIPAHAGEPVSSPSFTFAMTVYPRPRGGAVGLRRTLGVLQGLSPPTRGSQRHKAVVLSTHGSIPAHAGEPFTSRITACKPRVYPRPRGGA